ncbi:MAG TPA: hypothetical protein VIX12_03275, partial [Candidatus Binataceae bacterium]
MSTSEPGFTGYLLKIAEAALIDVPAAAIKRVALGGDDREMRAAAWKAYDAAYAITNEATNRLYGSKVVGRL